MKKTLTDSFDLTEKVIIITGGSGVLGSRYAEAVSLHGANVVIVDKNFETAKKLEKKIKQKYKTNPFAIKTDLTDKDSVKQMVQKVMKKYSKIDVLVNNAAYPEGVKERTIPFEKTPLLDLEKVFQVNIAGTYICCQEVGKIMAKKKQGVIVNVSSIYGMVGADQRIYDKSSLNSTAAYAITKAGIINFTRYLAAYWANKGIRVNTLSLGGVENGQDPNFIKNYSTKTMIGRMASKNDYIDSMLFLISDASVYMTGSNLVVDGGWTSW